MNPTGLPFITEISKLQEQILLPFFIKLSRFQERFVTGIGGTLTKDKEPRFFEVYEKCSDYTLTPITAMYAMYQAASYVSRAGIRGDIVECGVWKGGSSMIAARALMQFNSLDRRFYLYDTFEGMPEIDARDQDLGTGPFQLAMNLTTLLRGGHSGIFYASLEEVQKNMRATGYPPDRVVFVKGMVEDTIPGRVPHEIALLHLDSDLYRSTYHELTHLFPLLSQGGVLIIDDYGNWKGSRDATDRYFAEHGVSMLLNTIGDCGARMGIKV